MTAAPGSGDLPPAGTNVPPACAQCGYQGGGSVLYSWTFEGGDRYICRDSVACIERQRADDDGSSGLDMLSRTVAAFWQAMAAEDVPSNTAARITNRVLYGDPGGPAAVYEIRDDGSTAVHMGPKPAFLPGMTPASSMDTGRAQEVLDRAVATLEAHRQEHGCSTGSGCSAGRGMAAQVSWAQQHLAGLARHLNEGG